MSNLDRIIIVDASTFITLAEVGRLALLRNVGIVYMPDLVADEIETDPAKAILEEVEKPRASTAAEGWVSVVEVAKNPYIHQQRHTADWSDDVNYLHEAANHLGRDYEESDHTGDVGILGTALGFINSSENKDIVVVTDDKPLRKTCKALGIPVSGSIGVVIAAVERGDLDPDEAKDSLVAMDEVGARLSARLLRKAERLIDEAAEIRGD